MILGHTLDAGYRQKNNENEEEKEERERKRKKAVLRLKITLKGLYNFNENAKFLIDIPAQGSPKFSAYSGYGRLMGFHVSKELN